MRDRLKSEGRGRYISGKGSGIIRVPESEREFYQDDVITKKAGPLNPAFFAFWHAGETGLKLLDSSLLNVMFWQRKAAS